ncbi:hypothetical protein ACFWMR_10230 [Amycolatopsis thailandensis]|uniref:hypothetical protein n=1 Tax=Amycolatopsis thailandensis TaxID=589330 RepID=UPI00364C98B1
MFGLPSNSQRRLERYSRELPVFADLYRKAESSGSVAEVTHAGWRAGARLWPGSPAGRLLAYNDEGAEAVCRFRPGDRTLFGIQTRGHQMNTVERGFAIWGYRPGVFGAVDAGVPRLEITDVNGVVYPADIVAHTFVIDVDLGPWEPPELTVRVYDKDCMPRYEGPLLAVG